jgi:hypothetical protein
MKPRLPRPRLSSGRRGRRRRFKLSNGRRKRRQSHTTSSLTKIKCRRTSLTKGLVFRMSRMTSCDQPYHLTSSPEALACARHILLLGTSSPAVSVTFWSWRTVHDASVPRLRSCTTQTKERGCWCGTMLMGDSGHSLLYCAALLDLSQCRTAL